MTKKRNAVVMALSVALLAVIMTVCGCAGSREDILGRRGSPYTREQVEEILLLAYDEEFTVVGVEEVEHQRVEYTLEVVEHPGLTFSFIDSSDGLAGWRAWDDYAQSVLMYCAERQGFEPIFDSVTIGEGIMLEPDESADSVAARFSAAMEEYFEIYHTAREVEKYPTYSSPEEGRRVWFKARVRGCDPMFTRTLALEDDGGRDYTGGGSYIFKSMTEDEVSRVFEDVVLGGI